MNEELNATPGAVELAEEAGIDLSKVEGTGAEGKIYKADVELYLAKDVGSAPRAKERAEEVDLHTIVRTISKTNTTNLNAFPAMQIDAYVSSWIENGYELVDTHYLGTTDEGFIMMYILLRQ